MRRRILRGIHGDSEGADLAEGTEGTETERGALDAERGRARGGGAEGAGRCDRWGFNHNIQLVRTILL